jgi:hypothetical protein
MRRVQKQLIDQTLEFWQARSSKTLTREDARQMIENVTGFFQLLQEWQLADQLSASYEKHTARKNIVRPKSL